MKELLNVLEITPYSTLKALEIQRIHKNNGTRKPKFLEGLKITQSKHGNSKKPCIDFTFGAKTKIVAGNYVSIIKCSENSIVFVLHSCEKVPENGYVFSVSENANREYAFCVKVCNDEGVRKLADNIGIYNLEYKQNIYGENFIVATKQIPPLYRTNRERNSDNE